MNTTLIKFFNCALVEDNKMDFTAVNNYAMQRGYIIHPDVCNESVLKFLEEISIDYNATFYKSWSNITESTSAEILFDQLLHYATTYGTNFALGKGYVPNDGAEGVPDYSDFKVILPITVEEVNSRCLDLLETGIALKQDTMKDVADFVIEHTEQSVLVGKIDSIKNREALVYICSKTGLYPREKFNLLRYIIYKTTGQTMIVNNDSMFKAIAQSRMPFDLASLDNQSLVNLSSIFLRYKELFCAFKHCSQSAKPVINKLRKLAVKYHEPCKQSFWGSVFAVQHSADELAKHVSELTPYKKVALMQTCLERMSPLENQMYLVRNQKVFVRENYKPNNNDGYLMTLYTSLRMSLIEDLKRNSQKKTIKIVDGEEVEVSEPKTIKTVNGLHISLPTSEKSFIGNYPYGTSYDMSENNYLGIYWRNEWGTNDYDLSLMSNTGHKVGWNGGWTDQFNDVVFSGDMTNAAPEATEVILFKRSCPLGIIKVNQYRRCQDLDKYKFRLFFGQEDIKDLYEGYMVNPNSIKLSLDIVHKVDEKEMLVGVTNGERIVLMAVNTGDKCVSYSSKYDNMMMECIMHKSKCFVDAAELLSEAGYNVVDESFTGKTDVDFQNLDKDSLISLMKLN